MVQGSIFSIKILPSLGSGNGDPSCCLYSMRTTVFSDLSSILNFYHTSQPITVPYFSNRPITSFGDKKFIKKCSSKKFVKIFSYSQIFI